MGTILPHDRIKSIPDQEYIAKFFKPDPEEHRALNLSRVALGVIAFLGAIALVVLSAVGMVPMSIAIIGGVIGASALIYLIYKRCQRVEEKTRELPLASQQVNIVLKDAFLRADEAFIASQPSSYDSHALRLTDEDIKRDRQRIMQEQIEEVFEVCKKFLMNDPGAIVFEYYFDRWPGIRLGSSHNKFLFRPGAYRRLRYSDQVHVLAPYPSRLNPSRLIGYLAPPAIQKELLKRICFDVTFPIQITCISSYNTSDSNDYDTYQCYDEPLSKKTRRDPVGSFRCGKAPLTRVKVSKHDETRPILIQNMATGEFVDSGKLLFHISGYFEESNAYRSVPEYPQRPNISGLEEYRSEIYRNGWCCKVSLLLPPDTNVRHFP